MDFDSFTFYTLSGSEAAPVAQALWENLPEKTRRAALFEIDYSERGAALSKLWRASSHVCMARHAGTYAFGWLYPACAGARTAYCHFIMPDASRAAQKVIGRYFADKSLEFYDCLACLVPAPYYGVRRLLAEIGFEETARLPGAAYFAAYNRQKDGIMCLLKRDMHGKQF